MRLIRLSANKPSFKTVEFRPTGLTLIVGRHRGDETTDLNKTYNGVGKSLIVALVDYCLGSNKNPVFDRQLPGWTFSLTFEHDGKTHEARRSTGDGNVFLDEEKLRLKKFQERLSSAGIFSIPSEPIPFLTFRTLLAYFLRPKHGSYTRYDQPQPRWSDYQSVLSQSFLLGLDFERAVEKHDQKKKLDEQRKLADRYKKDEDLRSFYLGQESAEVELLELRSQIEKLEKDLDAFRVAENYSEREENADRLHARLADLRNETVVQENLIEDLKLALEVKPDVSPDRVLEIYKEASVALPGLVVKRLEEVRGFHRRLQANRSQWLGKELKAAQKKLRETKEEVKKLQKELDAELQFLNTHRALDEYAANNAHLSKLRGRERRIQDYTELVEQHTEQIQKLKADMAQATVQASEYLHFARPHLDRLMEKFREYSKELYGDVPAGLTVKNNDGVNQARYEINAHIQNDAADGINQGRLFCFDLLLLSLQERHGMEFLFHDNRLFADMDKNQRLSLFRLAERVCRDEGFQYIATVNEDVIDSVRDIAGDDFERLFVKPVVLELTDEPGGEGKLLGIQVDMSYDNSMKQERQIA